MTEHSLTSSYRQYEQTIGLETVMWPSITFSLMPRLNKIMISHCKWQGSKRNKVLKVFLSSLGVHHRKIVSLGSVSRLVYEHRVKYVV